MERKWWTLIAVSVATFFADYRPTYRPEPAARLWGEIVPFLARHLQDG